MVAGLWTSRAWRRIVNAAAASLVAEGGVRQAGELRIWFSAEHAFGVAEADAS